MLPPLARMRVLHQHRYQVKSQRKKVIEEAGFVSKERPQLLIHSHLIRAEDTCKGLFGGVVSGMHSHCTLRAVLNVPLLLYRRGLQL